MKHHIAYERAAKVGDRDLGFLFQRLNYFLVGTAFLITGLAALVVSADGNLNGNSLRFAYIIAATGGYLSFFFTIINYLNSRIAFRTGQYILKLEKKVSNHGKVAELPPSKIINLIVQSVLRKGYWGLVKGLFCEVWGLFLNPFKASKRSMAQHTYLIPYGFTIFWVVVFFGVLPWSWIAATVFLGLAPLILIIRVVVLKIMTCCCQRTRADKP